MCWDRFEALSIIEERTAASVFVAADRRAAATVGGQRRSAKNATPRDRMLPQHRQRRSLLVYTRAFGHSGVASSLRNAAAKRAY